MKKIDKYILFWLSGSISQLGSSMTGFALMLWIYTNTSSAMKVSLLSFSLYLPYIIVSLFAGNYIAKNSKKKIILISDTIAAISSISLLVLWNFKLIEIWHIYIVNIVIGAMNAFQEPAQSVAIGIIVPKDKLKNISGMDSFSSSLISIVSPVLASIFFSFGGLSLVIAFDLISFLIAFSILLFFIDIPEKFGKNIKRENILNGFTEGFKFLLENKGLLYIILTMSLMNFFSRITYENILSPMILARTNNNSYILGFVNSLLGIGGIVGGLIVSIRKLKLNNIKLIYYSAAISFLIGDVGMAIGQNIYIWSIAAIGSTLFLPFINAGQRMILYETVPMDKQAIVFSVRNGIQFSTVPVGILLGGYLADYIFEPFMKSETILRNIFSKIVGIGNGSGMALMFLFTGIFGFLFSIIFYNSKKIKEIKK